MSTSEELQLAIKPTTDGGLDIKMSGTAEETATVVSDILREIGIDTNNRNNPIDGVEISIPPQLLLEFVLRELTKRVGDTDIELAASSDILTTPSNEFLDNLDFDYRGRKDILKIIELLKMKNLSSLQELGGILQDPSALEKIFSTYDGEGTRPGFGGVAQFIEVLEFNMVEAAQIGISPRTGINDFGSLLQDETRSNVGRKNYQLALQRFSQGKEVQWKRKTRSKK